MKITPTNIMTLGLLVSIFILLVGLNLVPEQVAGFCDLGTPWAAPWSMDSRTSYGWPLNMVRVFDRASTVNEPGRFDYAAILVNAIAWCAILALAFIPRLLAGLRNRQRDNKKHEPASHARRRLS